MLSKKVYEQAEKEIDKKLSHMQNIIFEDAAEKQREILFKEVEFTVRCRMKRRWAIQFLSMLKCMEDYGTIGCSREVGMYADGDGDFRPDFNWDIDIEGDAEPARDKDGDRIYDAG